MLVLIVNGNELEIPDESIKYTIQNNNISDLESRQCNYTNSFSIPKIRLKVHYLNELGLVGDVSRLPYEKVSASILENGVNIITDGWLEIKETTNEFKLNIRDGSIDLFKAIENKTFADIDLSEIDHVKNIPTIISSFNNPIYKYIINDYGGKTHTQNGTKINTDYLVPSVNVKYLWDKIFETYGFNYIAEILSHPDFTELWMTYPKGFNEFAVVDLYAEFSDFEKVTSILTPRPNNLPFDNVIINNGSQIQNNKYIVPENASYKITFNGLESWNIGAGSNNISLLVNSFEVSLSDGLTNKSIYLNLNIGDIVQTANLQPLNIFVGAVTDKRYFKVEKVNNLVNFNDALSELKLTDFFKEILNVFSLTIFIDRNGNYIFKTFNDRLQSGVLDWSDKYLNRTSETYTPKNYGQFNYFKHKYNIDNSDYNNGRLTIANVNLKDRHDVLNSFLYSHEQFFTTFRINATHNEAVHPTLLWQREVNENNDNQEVKYKELSNRFHFIRYETINKDAVLRSEILLNEQSITSLPVARFSMTTYKDFTPKYYNNIKILLDDFRLHKFRLNLDCVDINTLDLDKVYYFEQEQQYYILNRLTYENGKISAGEFYRIKYTEADLCANFEVNDDFVNIYVGDETIINVLSNDAYDVGTLQMIIESQPTHGTVTLNQNNTITYVHDGSENLSDSFEYYLSNGLCSGVATVYINVISGCYELVSADYQPQQDPQFLGLNFTDCDGNPYGYDISGLTPINICANINSINTGLPPDIGFSPNQGNITNTEIENAILNNNGIVNRNIVFFDINPVIIGTLTLKFNYCD